MSGMFEPKNDKAVRKLAQTQKDQKAKRKKRITAITIITVLVIVSAVAITINSSFIRRTIPVVTIDGIGFTAAEFEYYFNMEYSEYREFMSQFQGMEDLLPNTSRPLSSQIYNEETGETWAEFITSMAFANMAELASLYNAAKAAGFELSQEQKEELEYELAMVEIQAMISGFPTSDMLLQRMFGNSMNERIYRKIMEFLSISRNYSEHIRESFSYTSDTLAAYYNENRDEFDAFNFRQMFISTEINDEQTFEDEDDFEAAISVAASEAYEKALEIAGSISSEEDFINAAANREDETFDPDSTLNRMLSGWLEPEISEWLLEDTRAFGDTTVIYNEQGSLIIFFLSRDDNSYRTVGMRQILFARDRINPADFPEGEHDPGYQVALELAEREVQERAEYVYALFTAMGENENALLELMEEHSDDDTEGGYYSNITMIPYQSQYIMAMRVVPEIETWLFDEERAIGDSALIYTADFGYHLIYFTGFGEIFSELIADDRMRTRDHTAWLDSFTHGVPVKHAAFILVHI